MLTAVECRFGMLTVHAVLVMMSFVLVVHAAQRFSCSASDMQSSCILCSSASLVPHHLASLLLLLLLLLLSRALRPV
jgi:hypothetical protein